VKAKARATNREIYGGDHPTASPEVMDRIRKTNLARYGTEFPMYIAREAFIEQTGYDNPFQVPEIKEKAEASMMAKHGVSRALQSPEIRDRMEERNLIKHGVRNVMESAQVQESMRNSLMSKYGRPYYSQAHLSDETIALINDRAAFTALFDGRSLREVATAAGIAYDTARKYCYRYDIRLPRSSYEDAICSFLQEHGIDYVQGDRKLIAPYEIDILVPSHNLAIEFHGIYWHSERHKTPTYHQKKLHMVNDAEHRLISIFEDEWLEKREIVEARLLNALKLTTRGGQARSLQVRRIEPVEARVFLDRYHIQGGGSYGFAAYGAFLLDGTLVAVMTFANSRVALGGKRNGPIELLRFATDSKNYPGVASKLFNAFVREFHPQHVISFADLRWSDDGKVYQRMGFTKVETTRPNYWYVHGNRIAREYRWKYQKGAIKHLVPDGENKSEREIMIELGYSRIWDCGHLKFDWKP
jgi:hypothetical protein